jgi:hypothetical protein
MDHSCKKKRESKCYSETSESHSDVECVDFFFSTASIAGAQALSLLQLASLGDVRIFTNLQNFYLDPAFTGIPSGLVPATSANPVGTIVPTNLVPPFQDKDAPVIYDAPSNTFIVLKKGLYEITYNIQGIFQFVCPLGIQLALFVNGQRVQASSQRASTSIGAFLGNAGQGFNISKTVCLYFDKDGTVEACNNMNLHQNTIQLRAIVNDAASVACISIITNLIRTGEGAFGPLFLLGPAGTLLPNNALEITFERISDTCTQEC